jgi:hypothetical protein
VDTLISTPSGRIIIRVPVTGESLNRLLSVPADAVAVFGAIGDWAAYVGVRQLTDEQIRDNGVKLYANEAAPLFPYLNIESYRP